MVGSIGLGEGDELRTVFKSVFLPFFPSFSSPLAPVGPFLVLPGHSRRLLRIRRGVVLVLRPRDRCKGVPRWSGARVVVPVGGVGRGRGRKAAWWHACACCPWLWSIVVGHLSAVRVDETTREWVWGERYG
jgi:hypothetical protein